MTSAVREHGSGLEFSASACRSTIIEHWFTAPFLFALTPSHIVVAAAVALVAWLLLRGGLHIAQKALDRAAAMRPGVVIRAAADIVRGTSGLLIALTALLIGIGTLALPSSWSSQISHLWFLTLILQFALWCNRAIAIALDHYFARAAGDSARLSQASAASTLLTWALHTALWSIVLLAILSNIGVNITAFVASLGVGGIAVALAAQNILGDLFASLAIAVDKPFEVGDSIGVGTVSGTVERIGLKTTRIRSASGEQVVMSNTDLLKQTIRNFRRLQTRRIVYTVGISYDATPEQVEEVPRILRRLVEADAHLRFDRAHLAAFGESSINFECVFHVQTPDYRVYMDSQQAIGIALMREFARLGVSFAFPSRTVYLATARDGSPVQPAFDAAKPAGGPRPADAPLP